MSLKDLICPAGPKANIHFYPWTRATVCKIFIQIWWEWQENCCTDQRRIYHPRLKPRNLRPYFIWQRYITTVNGERLAGENRICITSIKNIKVLDDIIDGFGSMLLCRKAKSVIILYHEDHDLHYLWPVTICGIFSVFGCRLNYASDLLTHNLCPMSKSEIWKRQSSVRSGEFQATVKTAPEAKPITSLSTQKWITFRIPANVHPFLPVKWTLEKWLILHWTQYSKACAA